ncbi:MAG: IS30 family transposase [Clostridium sp.]|nr:IS30 family transposase [Clostridium sp.]
MKKFHHLTRDDRLKIEALLKEKHTPQEIADNIGVHVSTIYREQKRGRYTHLLSDLTTEERYSPDIADEKYRNNLAEKGPGLKIGNNIELANYIEDRIINDNYSPAAVLGEIQQKGLQFGVTICVTTLYSYIDKGIFLNLTNDALTVKKNQKRAYKKVQRQRARAQKGDSIEKRPEEVESRETFGHWEMDTVVGKQGVSKKSLLVLTERKTRKEIIIELKQHTAENVARALNRLERQAGAMFYKIFKTITVDNGSEFQDCEGLEKALNRKGSRTKIYYCHPYRSCERGSNENQNRMIRRRIPKGTDLDQIDKKTIKEVEDWINNYPRRLFGYASANEMFEKEIAAILQTDVR